MKIPSVHTLVCCLVKTITKVLTQAIIKTKRVIQLTVLEFWGIAVALTEFW